MKFLKAFLALVLCRYLPQPIESRPIGLRGKTTEASDDNEVLLTDVGKAKKVPEAKSATNILDPNLLDPNNKGMMEARPDVGLDLDRFDHLIPVKTRPKPNPCCEGDDHPGFADPAYTEYKDCEEEEGQQEVSRLKWAVRYLRAAVGSKPFETCLRDAVRTKIHLKTSHEHEWVGPYVPCCGADLEDPEFILNSFNYQYVAYDVVMNTAKFAGSTSKRKLKLECEWTLDSTMDSPSVASNRWDYDSTNWDQQKTHWVRVNKGRVFSEYPNHAIGQNDWPEIFGTVGWCDYDNWDGHSYPVDEISGMILHEMLHNIRIDHGSESGNECAYDSYNCDAHGSGTCRANSLNEIAEACVSEVVEESIRRCHPERCCHRYQVPIWVEGDMPSSLKVGGRRNLAIDKSNFDLDVSVHRVNFGSCECESFW